MDPMGYGGFNQQELSGPIAKHHRFVVLLYLRYMPADFDHCHCQKVLGSFDVVCTFYNRLSIIIYKHTQFQLICFCYRFNMVQSFSISYWA